MADNDFNGNQGFSNNSNNSNFNNNNNQPNFERNDSFDGNNQNDSQSNNGVKDATEKLTNFLSGFGEGSMNQPGGVEEEEAPTASHTIFKNIAGELEGGIDKFNNMFDNKKKKQSQSNDSGSQNARPKLNIQKPKRHRDKPILPQR